MRPGKPGKARAGIEELPYEIHAAPAERRQERPDRQGLRPPRRALPLLPLHSTAPPRSQRPSPTCAATASTTATARSPDRGIEGGDVATTPTRSSQRSRKRGGKDRASATRSCTRSKKRSAAPDRRLLPGDQIPVEEDESGRRVSNPRPRAWEARALPTELRPRARAILRPGAPGSNLPARERPIPPRLPRRLRRRRPARLRPAQQGLGQDRGRRPGAGQGAARPRRARARARSPTTAATGSWSTSGPPGACPAATRRRRSSASARAHRDEGVTVLGINVQDNSEDALAFVASSSHLPAAALGRRRAQRSLRLDRRPRELPRRPAGQAGADPAPARSTRASSSRTSTRSSKAP